LGNIERNHKSRSMRIYKDVIKRQAYIRSAIYSKKLF